MSDHPSDKATIEAVLNGDSASFEKLVQQYQQKLFMYVLKYIHDEESAADVVQEAFIKMYINLNSYDLSRPFSAWAYRITHNEMINHIRKNKPVVEYDERTQYDDVYDDRPDLAEEIDKSLKANQLHLLISKLPMKYKEVINLHYFEHCDYDAISQVICRPSATVGTRLRRAKEQLKQLYLKEYGNET